jgi:hypothetical protein
MNIDYMAGAGISSGYVATSNGVVYLTQSKGSYATEIAINGTVVLQMNGHSGSSHGQPRPCATVLLGKGQTITFANCETAYFFPWG